MTRRTKPILDDLRTAALKDRLKKIDDRRAEVQERCQHLGDDSFEAQELRRENAKLAELRTMTTAEIETPSVTITDPRTLKFIAFRAKELREHLTASAEEAAHAGDHRAAVQKRIDAIRAWDVAEYDLGHRKSLAGYTSAWA